jgi:LysM repeat protein
MLPQQTGGLKLMTVFIAVLALHVLVIGGFTVYHLMSAGSSDADLTLDKTHKLKIDGTATTDAATADDKTTGTTPPAADTASTTGTTTPSTGATETAAATGTTTEPAPPPVSTAAANPSATPTPASTPAPKPNAPSPLVVTSDELAQSPGLAPPPEPGMTPSISTPAPTASATAPMSAPAAINPAMTTPAVAGPVHMPAVAPAPAPAIASSTEAAAAHPAVTHDLATHEASTHEMKKEMYTVKITDSYKKIAHAHHITVAQLKEANHIKDDTLHAGQKLMIPAAKTSVAKSEKPLDSAAPSGPIASETASLSASPEPAVSTHHHTYTVAKGDTLKKIARKLNVSASALREANNLTDTSKLSVGRKLKIPAKESRSASATTMPSPSPARPSQVQVETQPAPIAPAAQPEPVMPPTPAPTPASSPELANMTF